MGQGLAPAACLLISKFNVGRLTFDVHPTPMPTPNKNYKQLNHKDVLYRWILQNKSGSNEMVVVASAPVNGQELVVALPRVVNPQMVPKAIDFALENGWKPMEAGEPFRCLTRRGGFELAESQ